MELSRIHRCRVCGTEAIGTSKQPPLGWGSMWGNIFELFNWLTDMCPDCMDNWELKFHEKCPIYLKGGSNV